ncbi:hypothetical protein SCLCIDRAFT_1223735 [Scleroderma citrinum Foug A]|uniref:Uncharacterized protein n=1 Tax=Scleroderma citrinum Foug A TaxID=1036808 RepID=A0A0C2YRW1_9AGAM|nr:hypothetical protein SCLCIDRAFT_1223735 [Scleroderma citrinum Foug A]
MASNRRLRKTAGISGDQKAPGAKLPAHPGHSNTSRTPTSFSLTLHDAKEGYGLKWHTLLIRNRPAGNMLRLTLVALAMIACRLISSN